MMIIGCDFHPSWQQVCWLDTETGETGEQKLVQAAGDAERFYRQVPAPALIGMEATGNCHWLVDLLSELGHELWVGDAGQLCAAAEDGQAGRGTHFEAAGGRTVSAHLDAVCGSARSAATAAASLQAGDPTGTGEERVATPVSESGSAAPAQAVESSRGAGAARVAAEAVGR